MLRNFSFLAIALTIIQTTSTAPAWACESYDDCINHESRHMGSMYGFTDVGISNNLKAIAFKLSDIHEELKKQNAQKIMTPEITKFETTAVAVPQGFQYHKPGYEWTGDETK